MDATAPREAHRVKLRLASAAVGIPIILLAVYLGESGVGALVILAALVGGYEIARMSTPPVGSINVFLVVMPPAVAGTGIVAGSASEDWWVVAAVLAAGVGPAMAFEAARVARSAVSISSVMIAAYLGLLLAHGPLLRSLDDTGYWLLLALLTTFAVDTAAFFTGRAIGRRRLAPSISPSKTWEGAAGGLAAGIATATLLTFAFDLDLELAAAVLIGTAAAVVAVIGDLLESALKRKAGVKDTGGLVPGHGGILDRLDSLAPNLAVVYWSAIWLSR